MTSAPAEVVISKKPPGESVHELHSIPCKLNYTGPANVSSYFVREKCEEGLERAGFRGHGLNGRPLVAPEGHSFYVLKEKTNTFNGKTRQFDIVEERKDVMLWEWDRESGASSNTARALASMKIAQALVED